MIAQPDRSDEGGGGGKFKTLSLSLYYFVPPHLRRDVHGAPALGVFGVDVGAGQLTEPFQLPHVARRRRR